MSSKLRQVLHLISLLLSLIKSIESETKYLDICDENIKIVSLLIDVGFHIDKQVIILGVLKYHKLQQPEEELSDYYAIQSMHDNDVIESDVIIQTNHSLWKSTIWKEMTEKSHQAIDKSNDIISVFVLTKQITKTLGYAATGNHLYVYTKKRQIEHWVVENFKILTTELVYDPTKSLDDTKQLNMHHLLLHYPIEKDIHVNAIYLWPLEGVIRTFVYTTENYNNMSFYMRHVMMATPLDDAQKKWVWSYDLYNDACDPQDHQIKGTTYIVAADDKKGGVFTMTFLEFSDYYFYKSDFRIKDVGKYDISKTEQFSNLEIISCTLHPKREKITTAACEDYPPVIDDEISRDISKGALQKSEDSESGVPWGPVWMWLIVIALFIVIFALMFVGFTYCRGTEPKPTEPKPTEPNPTEPKPTESKLNQPKPTEPKPTDKSVP